MCGIAGIIGKAASVEIVKKMTDAIAHRGPDGEGVFFENNVCLGHRRLSIIDLSDEGKQPMTSHDGRFTIVFNGEIYNYRELREELKGYPFFSQTDTEVILAAWEKWGEKALDRFLGMFAFAIYDKQTGVTTLVRDRFGIKPLFYTQKDGSLYFGSEIKALRATSIPFSVNNGVIGQYLLHGYYDHSEKTFFEEIRSFPAGYIAQVKKDGSFHMRRYWYLPDQVGEISQLKDQECLDAFFALAEDSVRLHMRSDVSVGVNLSSGIDSMSLFSLLQKTDGLKGLHVFSIGYADLQYDETTLVQDVMKKTNIPFHRFEMNENYHNNFVSKAIHMLDQPFGGLSTISYIGLNSLAKEQGITVLLEGQGVDEFFGGYRYYYGSLYRDYLKNRDVMRIRREIRRIAQGTPPAQLVKSFFSFANTARFAKRQVFQDGSAFLRRGCLNKEWTEKQKTQTIPKFDEPFENQLSNALYRDVVATKLPRVLRFNDLVSMAFGRELRVPFLDHRLAELAFSLENRWKIDDGVSKVILREAVKELVPESVRTKQKRPQSSPQTYWYKTTLRDWVLSEIRGDAMRQLPMVDVRATEKAFLHFVADPKDQNSFFFWQLINLARWYQTI